MIEINGKHGSAKVFIDSALDDASALQIIDLVDQPFAEGSTIRMMPDVHAGAGCTIGTTMTIKDKVCPNLVGVDIGCGMLAARLVEDNVDFKKLDQAIRENVPAGMKVRDKPHPIKDREASELLRLNELRCIESCDLERAYRSIGTLGGGNHFIELDVDKNRYLWLVIHTGSRHLGLEVANHYQKKAIAKLHGNPTEEILAVIQKLQSEGRHREIEGEIRKIKSKSSGIPKDLCWVEGQDFEDYIHDMEIVQKFARTNRYAILETIFGAMQLHLDDYFTTTHNYIDTEAMILRKGAISAKKGQKVIIPMNMRDGSLICIGKGNPDWNYSAPHGAGRIMSRAEAKKKISMDDYTESMRGIWTTSVDANTLDESPMAYKPMESIINNIGDTVEVIDTIKPIYNFKASE